MTHSMHTLHALPPGVSLRVVLLRHGEPVEASRGRCYGKLDVGLSDRGRAQIRAVTEELSGSEFGAIYASPRTRARESAELLGERIGQAITLEPRFAEIDFGEFEGLRYEEVERRYPQAYAAWMHSPTQVHFPGGESFAIMQARVLAALADARARHQGGCFVVVSHGGVGRIALAEALNLGNADIFRIGQDHANLSWVDYYGESPVVRGFNWTAPA